MSFLLPEDDGYFAQQRREQLAVQPQLLLLPPSSTDPSVPPPVHVDALPYVDEQYNDPDVKARVHALITQEMQQSTTTLAQYAASLHTRPALSAVPSLQPAYTSPAATLAPLTSRHIAATFPSPPTPLASLIPPRPPSPAADATSDELATHLQYLQSTDVHLQLLRHYGPQQSNTTTRALQQRRAELEAEVQRETTAVAAVNGGRRERQLEVGQRLQWLEGEWWRLVSNVTGMRRRMDESTDETQTKRVKTAAVSAG